MQQLTSQRLTHASSRRGIATLEFAMALPFLLLLMVAITWLGFSVIGQTEVLVIARNNTWKQRFEDKAKQPLMFPSGISVAKNPFYSQEDDYVTEKASKKVDVSPIFALVPGPEASATILAGSWDHQAMKFDKPPEWELMAIAAASGTGGKAQTWLTNLNDPIGRVKDAVGQMLTQNKQRNDEINDNNAASDSPTSPAKESEEKTKVDRAAEKRKYEERLQQLGGRTNPFNNQVIPTVAGGELDKTIDEIDRLRGDIALKEQIPKAKEEEEAKKQQAEIDSMRRRLELFEGKRKRIESDIRDAEAELKALDD